MSWRHGVRYQAARCLRMSEPGEQQRHQQRCNSDGFHHGLKRCYQQPSEGLGPHSGRSGVKEDKSVMELVAPVEDTSKQQPPPANCKVRSSEEDAFGLIHNDFFDHIVLLPNVQLQKGNPAREIFTGGVEDYRFDYTYTYDERHRPLVKAGTATILTGPNAGRIIPVRTDFSYY